MAVEVPGISDLRPLGSGSFSVVYEGVQDAFNRPVAVKVVQGRFDREAMQHFQEECLAVGPLSSHPNIITVFNTEVTSDGEACLVMELFPNGSLAARLEHDGPRPLDEVLRDGVALCGALETAHRAGVFHRDVKPENVLVASRGEPVLADFGVAVAGAQKATAQQAFTDVHAAPEILIDGPEPTAAVDVYALGSTLYELLAGAPAFPRRSSESRLGHHRRIAGDAVPPIPRGDVPDIVFEVIEAAMAKLPERRPSVVQLASWLGHVQQQLGQPRSEPVVMEPGVDEGPFADLPWPVPRRRDASGGTVVLEPKRRIAQPTGPDLGDVPPTQSKRAQLAIVGGALLGAIGIVAIAVVVEANEPDAPPPTTTSVTGLPSTTMEIVSSDLKPTGVSVSATGTGHLEVQWARPAQGAPIRYEVVFLDAGGKAQLRDVSGTATSAAIDGASPTTCVRVNAVFPSPTSGFVQGQSEPACPEP